MKSNNLRYWIFFCFLLFSTAATAGEVTTKEAEAFASKQGNELLQVLYEKDLPSKYEKLDVIFLNNVDLDYIAKFVVGKYWRDMDNEQRQKYQGLFKRYVIGTYKGFPLQFDDDQINFSILGSRIEGKNTFVTANIAYRKEDVTNDYLVEFRMHKPQDRILLTDIKIAESSLIMSYRSKFYQMIKDVDEDIEWFLEDFELTVNSIEKHYAIPD